MRRAPKKALSKSATVAFLVNSHLKRSNVLRIVDPKDPKKQLGKLQNYLQQHNIVSVSLHSDSSETLSVALEQLRRYKKLTHFTLSTWINLDRRILRALQACLQANTSLLELHLHCYAVQNGVSSVISSLPSGLEVLDISQSVSSSNVEHLVTELDRYFRRATQLHSFYARHCPNSFADPLFGCLANLGPMLSINDIDG